MLTSTYFEDEPALRQPAVELLDSNHVAGVFVAQACFPWAFA